MVKLCKRELYYLDKPNIVTKLGRLDIIVLHSIEFYHNDGDNKNRNTMAQ